MRNSNGRVASDPHQAKPLSSPKAGVTCKKPRWDEELRMHLYSIMYCRLGGDDWMIDNCSWANKYPRKEFMQDLKRFGLWDRLCEFRRQYHPHWTDKDLLKAAHGRVYNTILKRDSATRFTYSSEHPRIKYPTRHSMWAILEYYIKTIGVRL